MLASLRTNDHPGTCVPKFVVAWKQLLLGVPVGRVPHCHVVVAHAVATGGRGDRSGGRSTQRCRTHPPAPREAESHSSLPRRALGPGNPHPNRSGGAESFELVLHSPERPRILDSRSYPRPIQQMAAIIFSSFQDVKQTGELSCSRPPEANPSGRQIRVNSRYYFTPSANSASAAHSTGACPWKSPVRRFRAR
jgi:hypothetical protein